MPSKTEEYLALAQRTANGLTRYWESWTAYLTTASRLYKYRFEDQLMIYAQRPDATACADYDIWNNRMNRYVRRGSKGIALLDESSRYPRLHYVFDVSDTGVRRNSRDPDLWQYNDDLKQPVSDALTAAYGISHERFSQQLADIAGKLVADYWDNNSEDIRAIVDGSFLMDYDSTGLEMQFKSVAAISAPTHFWNGADLNRMAFLTKTVFRLSMIFPPRILSMPSAQQSATSAAKFCAPWNEQSKRASAAETMKGASMNMSSNLSYTQTGDYLLPNLTLHQPKTPLGKYGRMRLSFLRQQRPVLYNTMLLNGSLYPTLTELEQTAAAMKKQLMADLLAKNPAPDKEKNQMAWVQHMNSLQEQVEEVIRTELIYS